MKTKLHLKLMVCCLGFLLISTACKKSQTVPVAGYTEVITARTIVFTNISTDTSSSLWDFGDGTTSTDMSPSHTYAAAGTYTVKLVVTYSKSGKTNTKYEQFKFL